MLIEVWKDIRNYEGRYQASSLGRIRSLVKKDPLIMKGIPDKDGYFHITLYKDKKAWQTFVHRLIAQTFLDNPDNLPQVNHKDEDKVNNAVTNLEWCTAQYNQEYTQSKEYIFKSPDGIIYEIRNLRKFCREFNLRAGCMSLVFNRKRLQHKGWTTIS